MTSQPMTDLPLIFSIRQIGTLQDIRSKKRCLQNLSKLLIQGLSETESHRLGEDFSEFDIFDSLIAREQLGSTGIGEGCAIPHGRIMGIQTPKLAILTLSEPVDFDAIDAEPIDIALGLLVPESKHEEGQRHHLKILSMLSTFVNDRDNRQFLRREMSAETLYDFVTEALTAQWTAIEAAEQRHHPELTDT